MDTVLRQYVGSFAARLGLKGIDRSFEDRLDSYMRQLKEGQYHVRRTGLSSSEFRLAETYLAIHAVRIAKIDLKEVAEADDVKAAVWFFHVPTDENDTCLEATRHILEIDSNPSLKQRLNETVRPQIEQLRHLFG